MYRIPTLKEAAQAKDQPQTAEVVPRSTPSAMLASSSTWRAIRGWAPHPETHALDLLYMPMGDEDFAGQPATEKVIKKY